MRVRCIRPTGPLLMGAIYDVEVAEEYVNAYMVNGVPFMQDRFEAVDDQTVIAWSEAEAQKLYLAEGDLRKYDRVCIGDGSSLSNELDGLIADNERGIFLPELTSELARQAIMSGAYLIQACQL